MSATRARVWAALLLICASGTLDACEARGDSRSQPISYEISIAHPEQHLFHVVMSVPGVEGTLLVQMPAWNALYQIRDFSSHIQQVQALEGTKAAPIEKIDKQTWKIDGRGTIRVGYTIYWDEAGPFATQLNAEHAFINPAMVLMYVPGKTEVKAAVSITDIPSEWHEASAMPFECSAVASNQKCESQETTYNLLVDAPIEIGKFKEFAIPGVPGDIRAVVHGENWNQGEIESELSKICNYEIKLMDGPPFEHYTFILHIGKNAGGGGMEHANSTAIGIPSGAFLAGVAAHEFFHLWNVKRIRPATLEPVDFTKEQYTRALWFAEGVTSTYGAYTLVRTGLWNKDRFYQDLGDQITELESRPANRWQSAEQSSLDAWLEKYPLYNQPDRSVSYYTKGQVLGDLLDIVIRDRTDNEKSLDDVLRGMNVDFARRGRTYRDSLDVRLEAEKVAGGSFEEFFRDYVAGTQPFPYQKILGLAGLAMQSTEVERASLGFTPRRGAGGVMSVDTVEPASPAASAGLEPDDVILEWNGGNMPRSLWRWVRDRQPGEMVKMRIRRDEQEKNIEFALGGEKLTVFQVSEDAHASEKAKQIREGILQGATSAVAAH
ncbi:MAG TPA: hypothetical protein VJN93_12970 [Candidatus Acidoferrum sp.]|nr:hypothetical protein [Candidatus Acidoferrum sp.]